MAAYLQDPDHATPPEANSVPTAAHAAATAASTAPARKQVTLSTLAAMRAKAEKITMLTAYDASFAALMDRCGVEVLLIGDSLGMVCQGHDS
ncbi:MAG: 3-methyl-2-oxobutanoate hydroxymethyltransferase, partial [Janthinobacterium lividum]